MHAVVDCKKVVDLNNNSDDLGKVESISNVTLEEEEQEPVANVEEGSNLDSATSEEEEEFFDAVEEQEPLAGFNIPLSIFHYKGYDSDFFTSWYNISSRIFKEVNRACPEKKVLNLALSVLMFPYIVFTALGLAVYNKLKTNDKTQISSEENKTKKSEVSESTAKRLAYGVLAAIVILVNIAMLAALLIPATIALATFYLLNRKLSHSLIDVLKVNSGSYQKKHQNIEVSFHEIDAGKSDIKWDMEIKFPPQFEQLIRDLYEDKDGSWLNVARDSEHNTILKLSANINLKNGLRPLRNEIKNVLATSIQEFAKAMEELMKLEKKEITYDKLKELLNEFRLKVVDSIDSKLTTHLIENAYQVAFIQAIKIAQKRREKKKNFSLERALEDILVKQELESQGKELPSKRDIIKQTLKNLGKEDKREISRVVGVCKSTYPKETEKALDDAKKEIGRLREIGQKRYDEICEKLKEIHKSRGASNSTDGALKRKLEDLFKFECDDQEVKKKLIESRIRKAKVMLSQSGVLYEKQGQIGRLKQSMWNLLGTSSQDKEEQNLMKQLEDLEKEVEGLLNEEASDKINGFIEEAYPEIVKHKVQNLFKQQKKMLLENIEDLVSSLNEPKEMYDGEDNEVTLLFDRRLEDILHLEKMIKECLEQKEYDLLKGKIEKQSEDIRKSMRDDKNLLYFLDKYLMDIHLDSNEKFIKLLEQLEPGKGGLLINKKTTNDYREELESREKIKFAIIEDKLLERLKEKFNEAEIKKLLEEAELEYCLAEKRMKGPVIKTKDNIKHFCQDLLSSLIDNLVKNIINNVPKSDQSPWLQPKKSLGIMCGYVRMGWSATKKNESIEGKALDAARDTHKEVETFLQHFQSSYEEVGTFLGNLFSDDGVTFKNDVWPKVEEHLHGMWDRFFKDVEFKIENRLDEVNVTQQNQKTVITA